MKKVKLILIIATKVTNYMMEIMTLGQSAKRTWNMPDSAVIWQKMQYRLSLRFSGLIKIK